MGKNKKDECQHKKTARAWVAKNDYEEERYCLDCFQVIKKKPHKRRYEEERR
jgi:hypothetical protein